MSARSLLSIDRGKMAAMKILTGTGLFLAFCALGLLAMAICTDYWYETDARRHRERCKNYANKRTDPGYIYISNHNLPLQMPPKSLGERPGTGAALLSRGKRHFMAAASAMESHCSRQFNSTISGLWRKCHREGFDLETEDLIYKGKQSAGCSLPLPPVHQAPDQAAATAAAAER